MLAILLFAYNNVHSGLALNGMKKYSPYYKDIAHQKGDIEAKDAKSGAL